jgi:hypothetical protein
MIYKCFLSFCGFSFSWWCPLMQMFSILMKSNLSDFSFVVYALSHWKKKTCCFIQGHNLRTYLLLRIFEVLALMTVRFLIHLQFFHMMWSSDPSSFLCMRLVSCISIICWKDYSFLLSGLGTFGGNLCIHLFLNSQFYSIDLYVSPYASATLVWLLYLCSKLWNWELCVLQFCSLKKLLDHSEFLAFPYEF